MPGHTLNTAALDATGFTLAKEGDGTLAASFVTAGHLNHTAGAMTASEVNVTGTVAVNGAAALTVADPVTANAFNVNNGSAVIAGLMGSGAAPSTTVAAGQTLTVGAAVTGMDSVTLAGTLKTSDTTRATNVIKDLSMLDTGKWDLTDGFLVIDYDEGSSPLADVQQWIVSGRHGGDWLGNGITSSLAIAANTLYAVGYLDNDRLPESQRLSTFGDVGVDATSILVRFTWAADINLDGLVSDADATILGATYDNGLTTGRYWWEGDLTGDGKITDADATILGALYPRGAAGAGSPAGLGLATPEPATLSLLALGGLGMLLRRRRRAGTPSRMDF